MPSARLRKAGRPAAPKKILLKEVLKRRKAAKILDQDEAWIVSGRVLELCRGGMTVGEAIERAMGEIS